MKSNKIILFFILISTVFVSCVKQSENNSQNNNIEIKVNELLSKMTLEEKVGQMTQLNLDVISNGEIYKLDEPHQLNKKKLIKAIVDYKVGSILNCGGHTYSREHWHEIINQIQEIRNKNINTYTKQRYNGEKYDI